MIYSYSYKKQKSKSDKSKIKYNNCRKRVIKKIAILLRIVEKKGKIPDQWKKKFANKSLKKDSRQTHTNIIEDLKKEYGFLVFDDDITLVITTTGMPEEVLNVQTTSLLPSIIINCGTISYFTSNCYSLTNYVKLSSKPIQTAYSCTLKQDNMKILLLPSNNAFFTLTTLRYTIYL